MKKYKIGRYYYKEINEDKYLDMIDTENRILLFTFVDYDGEPFKYFQRIKNGSN